MFLPLVWHWMYCHVGYLKQDLVAQGGLALVISSLSTRCKLPCVAAAFFFLFFQAPGLTLVLFKVLNLRHHVFSVFGEIMPLPLFPSLPVLSVSFFLKTSFMQYTLASTCFVAKASHSDPNKHPDAYII